LRAIAALGSGMVAMLASISCLPAATGDPHLAISNQTPLTVTLMVNGLTHQAIATLRSSSICR